MYPVNPDPRTAQDRWLKVFSRPWRIPPRTDATRVDSPRRIAQSQHRIRVERAVYLIARSGCNTRAACRHVGLSSAAATEVTRLCDARNIPRRHRRGGMPYPKTIEGDYPVIVQPPA